MVEIESLRCFEAAAVHLKFRVAAGAVALSPAAFGDRIKRLEESLGVVLFDRTTRRVSLTPAGERLLPHARQILKQVNKCEQVVRVDAAPTPYEMTLGTRFELGMSWIVPSMKTLERARPERRLHLDFGNTSDLLTRVLRGQIDGMVTSARVAAGGLEYARLHPEKYAFVASKALIRRQPLKKAADAAAHTLLELGADLPLFRYFLDAVPAQDWDFGQFQFLGTIGPVRARVLEGRGVAVLPRYFVEKDLSRGRLVLLMPRVRMPTDWFRLIWRKGHSRAAELRELATELSKLPLR